MRAQLFSSLSSALQMRLFTSINQVMLVVRAGGIVQKRMGNRLQYWQMIRGLCILAVVMIHCPTGQGYLLRDYVSWLTLRQIINFPVAIFIFMSGYFVKREKALENGLNYLTNRGGVMLYQPYLIWSCVYLTEKLLAGEASGKYIVYALVGGKAAAPFYYIIVLLQLTIITPWILRQKNRKCLYWLTPIYLIIIYSYNIIAGVMPLGYEIFFPAWIFFYVLGMDSREGRLDGVIKMIRFRWIIVTLILSLAETYLFLKIGCADGFAVSQIKFSSFLYATMIIICLQKKIIGIKKNGISAIGDISYGIFWSHMLVLRVVQKTLKLVDFTGSWPVYFVLTFVFTVLGSIGIVIMVRAVLKKIGCIRIMKYIGF